MKMIVSFLLAAFFVAAQGNLVPVRDLLRADRPTGRITGGEEAEPHSYPFQVGLEIPYQGQTAFCGGTLISTKYVLTAAHCGELSQNIKVVLGAHNINNASEPTQVIIESEKVIVHEAWNSAQLINDIALVELKTEVNLTENIDVVTLPRFSEENNNYANIDAIAVGWGKDSDNATSISPVLREVTVPTLTNLVCRERFGLIGLLIPLHESNICTDGAEGKSTCNGDSGGPLLVTEAGELKQIGLTSFGISLGCEVGYPAVFTRLTKYLDWISRNTGIDLG